MDSNCAGLHATDRSKYLALQYICVHLYSEYVLWTMTKAMSAKVDAFDQRRILQIHYSQHVSNAEVRRRTGYPPLSAGP